MADYIPVPVEVAREIAEKYAKSIVIIFAHDPIHGLMPTTTYGSDPQNKAWAAAGGEIAAKALGGVLDESIQFEDYRLQQAKRLYAALQSVVALAGEAFADWDKDRDMRVGKILIALAESEKRGYRSDIDEIHDALSAAEKFLG